jgi:hypothetical protein
MTGHVEHWFNRLWGHGRRDVFLNRTPTGWQVVGREGGSEGREVVHYFDNEATAHATVEWMKETVPPQLANFKLMSFPKRPDRQREGPASPAS